jgi:hypothetical protein
MPKSFLDLINDAAAGNQPPILFPDEQVSVLQRSVWPRDGVVNNSIAQQSFTAGVKTYVIGTALRIPDTGLRVGTVMKWRFNLAKTAAGSATSLVEILAGQAGTIADLTQISIIKPAGTAAADSARVEILLNVRGPISASGICTAEFSMIHNLAATGHLVIPAACINTVSPPFDLRTPNLIFGIALTTGAADVCTTEIVQSELHNL